MRRKTLNLISRTALVIYLLAHGIVPPGFMLSDASSDGVFKLCHGDEHSAALMAFLQEDMRYESSHSIDAPREDLFDDSHAKLKQCLSAFTGFANVGFGFESFPVLFENISPHVTSNASPLPSLIFLSNRPRAPPVNV